MAQPESPQRDGTKPKRTAWPWPARCTVSSSGDWRLRTEDWRLRTVDCGLRIRNSHNQHRVAVAVKAIFVSDSLAIRGKDLLAASECRDQHQERRPRQMKVRNETLYHAKAMGGMNEQRGAASGRLHAPGCIDRQRLERTS